MYFMFLSFLGPRSAWKMIGDNNQCLFFGLYLKGSPGWPLVSTLGSLSLPYHSLAPCQMPTYLEPNAYLSL